MLYRLPTSRRDRGRSLIETFAVPALRDLGRRVAQWWRFRHDLRRLRALEDRLLADLGIERDHIAAIVKNGRRGPTIDGGLGKWR